jgi:disulfide bond formation protein DsbB
LVETAEVFFGMLCVVCQAFLAAMLLLWIFARVSPNLRTRQQAVVEAFRPIAIPLGFVVALTTISGSLYFSEVAHFTPCLMCWIQRSFLYPQVLFFGFLMFRPNAVWVRRMAMMFAALDIPVSLYHHLIERYPSLEGAVDCSAVGPSCTAPYFWQFGYITLAAMALTSATTLLVLLCIARNGNGRTRTA